MTDYSREYTMGRLDQGVRIYRSSNPRDTRVRLRAHDDEFAQRLQRQFGGTLSEGHWTLAGGRKVEAFLEVWAKYSARDDAAKALREMQEAPERYRHYYDGLVISGRR
jgi:hypothetical protein